MSKDDIRLSAILGADSKGEMRVVISSSVPGVGDVLYGGPPMPQDMALKLTRDLNSAFCRREKEGPTSIGLRLDRFADREAMKRSLSGFGEPLCLGSTLACLGEVADAVLHHCDGRPLKVDDLGLMLRGAVGVIVELSIQMRMCGVSVREALKDFLDYMDETQGLPTAKSEESGKSFYTLNKSSDDPDKPN